MPGICISLGAWCEQGSRNCRRIGHKSALAEIVERIIENAVSITSSVAERVDRCTTKSISGPGDCLGGHFEIPFLKAQFGIRLFVIETGDDHPIFEAKDGLEKASKTCAAFQVANVGFHGADVQRLTRCSLTLSKSSTQCPQF